MNRRFQRYIVRTEILSSFHARVEYICVKICHSNQWDRTTPKSPLSLGARGRPSNTRMPKLTPLTTQMTAQSVYAFSQNYTTKSPLLTTECSTFIPKLPLLLRRSPSLDRRHSPPQTASGSNQPFCHSTLSGHTHTDRQMG